MNHPTQRIYAIESFEARDLPHKKLSKSKCLLKLQIICFPGYSPGCTPAGRKGATGRKDRCWREQYHKEFSPMQGFRTLPSYWFSNSGHGFRPGEKRNLGKIQGDHQPVTRREALVSGKDVFLSWLLNAQAPKLSHELRTRLSESLCATERVQVLRA